MKSFGCAAVLSVFAANAALAKPVAIRDHDHLALSPKGDRVVDVEALDPGNLPDDPHGTVVLRDARGKILDSFDPCKACKYSDTAWAPNGATFAFIATDRKKGSATLYVVDKGKPRAATAIAGAANSVMWWTKASHVPRRRSPALQIPCAIRRMDRISRFWRRSVRTS